MQVSKHKERQNVYSMHTFDMEQPKDLYFMESISHTKIFIPLGCGCHQEKMTVISTTWFHIKPLKLLKSKNDGCPKTIIRSVSIHHVKISIETSRERENTFTMCPNKHIKTWVENQKKIDFLYWIDLSPQTKNKSILYINGISLQTPY